MSYIDYLQPPCKRSLLLSSWKQKDKTEGMKQKKNDSCGYFDNHFITSSRCLVRYFIFILLYLFVNALLFWHLVFSANQLIFFVKSTCLILHSEVKAHVKPCLDGNYILHKSYWHSANICMILRPIYSKVRSFRKLLGCKLHQVKVFWKIDTWFLKGLGVACFTKYKRVQVTAKNSTKSVTPAVGLRMFCANQFFMSLVLRSFTISVNTWKHKEKQCFDDRKFQESLTFEPQWIKQKV